MRALLALLSIVVAGQTLEPIGSQVETEQAALRCIM
jgi:hypothetical protein